MTAPSTPSPAPGWRDIESAPKDGPFLAFGIDTNRDDGSTVECMEVVQFSGDKDWPWMASDVSYAADFFSHWQPLPPPPTTEAGR